MTCALLKSLSINLVDGPPSANERASMPQLDWTLSVPQQLGKETP